MNAVLALKDGTIFEGTGFGSEGITCGEVVFNTSMVGYEQALTDPSCKGQILCMTFPLIGNYGVRASFFESDRIQVEGFIVKENSTYFSHRNAIKSVDKFLKEYGIPGISGIDTRALTKKIRVEGVMNGALCVGKSIDKEEVLRMAKKLPDISSFDLISKVSVKQRKEFDCKGKKTIAMIDLGVKNSIIGHFLNRKVNVILLPHNTTADEIEPLGVDGVLLSNGPGDPVNAKHAIKLVKGLHSMCDIPMFGICLGQQAIALAYGAKRYKLKFGHRGGNHPVKDIREDKVYITSQNHSFALDEHSIDGTGLEITMFNLNDKSVEGICNIKNKILAVQFHPEANPGPLDANHIFDRWVRMLG